MPPSNNPKNDPHSLPENTVAPAYRGGQPAPRGSIRPGDSREAAVSVLRSSIDSIYDNQGVAADQTAPTNPYERTHGEATTIAADEWKAYHSAWQEYYQKYYAGYYTQQLESAKETLKQEAPHVAHEEYFSAQPSLPDTATAVVEEQDEELSRDEALFDLRQKLLSSVRRSAGKVRHSRHFVPIAAAIAVVLIFAFLQYNQLIIGTVQAYVSPGAISPQNIVIDPNSNVAVSQDPVLIIPKINVDVPVEWGVGNDNDSQMAAMDKGVAQFAIPGADSYPGQKGNVVLAGHSSNDVFDQGSYKFIFAQLDRLQAGDSIYVDYQGTRYTYVISDTQVVAPTDIAALQRGEDKPMLTLITCTPVGTARNRLLVFANQVTPDPSSAKPAPDDAGAQNVTSIPGTQPTVLEKLFGAK